MHSWVFYYCNVYNTNECILHMTESYRRAFVTFVFSFSTFSHVGIYLRLVVRKPVFGVSDQVRHKPVCTVTEDGQSIEISYLGSREIVLYIYVAKLKALISFAVTAKLISAFVFTLCKKPVFSQPGSYFFL